MHRNQIVKKEITELNQNNLLDNLRINYKKFQYSFKDDKNMNFKGDKKIANNHWKCETCCTPDKQAHISVPAMKSLDQERTKAVTRT